MVLELPRTTLFVEEMCVENVDRCILQFWQQWGWELWPEVRYQSVHNVCMSSNLFSSRILIITKAVVKKEPRARRFSSGWTERNLDSECSNILRLKSEFEIYEFRFARKLNSGQSYLLFLLHVTAHLLRFDRCNLSVITETENTNNRAQVPGVVRRRFFLVFLNN